jgi:hypothetical protein
MMTWGGKQIVAKKICVVPILSITYHMNSRGIEFELRCEKPATKRLNYDTEKNMPKGIKICRRISGPKTILLFCNDHNGV